MRYVFAMIAGGLMITTSFISGSIIGGWIVHEVEKPVHVHKRKDYSVEFDAEEKVNLA